MDNLSKRKKDKRIGVRLLVGIFDGLLMMLLSYWMDGFGMLKDADAWLLRPIRLYRICMILAMLGVPAMCLAFSGWYEIIRTLREKRWVKRLFLISTVSYAVSSLYMIAIDCLPPIMYQTTTELGIASETALRLIEKVQKPYVIPVITFFLIEDVGISIVLWRLVLTDKLRVSKWGLVCCPAVMLVVDVILKLIPSALTHNISVTLESAGWLLFMLAGLIHISRGVIKTTIEIE